MLHILIKWQRKREEETYDTMINIQTGFLCYRRDPVENVFLFYELDKVANTLPFFIVHVLRRNWYSILVINNFKSCKNWSFYRARNKIWSWNLVRLQIMSLRFLRFFFIASIYENRFSRCISNNTNDWELTVYS